MKSGLFGLLGAALSPLSGYDDPEGGSSTLPHVQHYLGRIDRTKQKSSHPPDMAFYTSHKIVQGD
eukprot:9083189-Pyramimonas_sp.AAC.1